MTDRRLPGLFLRMFLRGVVGLLCVLGSTLPARAQALTTNVGPDLGAFSTGELQFSLVASGGNGVYAWDITAGALPPGVALRTDKPSWFPANASAGLIGVPDRSWSLQLHIARTEQRRRRSPSADRA